MMLFDENVIHFLWDRAVISWRLIRLHEKRAAPLRTQLQHFHEGGKTSKRD
jgi:hypothetical protein